jgi:hypothetical protein
VVIAGDAGCGSFPFVVIAGDAAGCDSFPFVVIAGGAAGCGSFPFVVIAGDGTLGRTRATSSPRLRVAVTAVGVDDLRADVKAPRVRSRRRTPTDPPSTTALHANIALPQSNRIRSNTIIAVAAEARAGILW